MRTTGHARMVKLVDTRDLKSLAPNRAYRFDPGSGHQSILIAESLDLAGFGTYSAIAAHRLKEYPCRMAFLDTRPRETGRTCCSA